MDPVPTAGPSLAWAAGTVIQVDGAKASSKALRAEAGEAVYAIQTGGAVSTRPHQTVVYIHLTVGTHKACQAAACEVEGKALVVLALATILAWGACLLTGSSLVLTVPSMEAWWAHTVVLTAPIINALASILAGGLCGTDVLIFVTELARPATMTNALPGLVAGTMLAARHPHTALTVQPLPAWVTPAGAIRRTAAVGQVTVGAAVIGYGMLNRCPQDAQQAHEMQAAAAAGHGQRRPQEGRTDGQPYVRTPVGWHRLGGGRMRRSCTDCGSER